MACRRIRRLVFLWVDREAGRLPRAPLERHLEECLDCRQRAEELERMILLVRARCRRENVPDGLAERIRRHIESVLPREESQ